MRVEHVLGNLGSAGCQPPPLGSLRTEIMFGRLPKIAGKVRAALALPALPTPET
jgi:hypothetical protein